MNKIPASRPFLSLPIVLGVLWSPGVLACGNSMLEDAEPGSTLGPVLLASAGGLSLFLVGVSLVGLSMLRRRGQG